MNVGICEEFTKYINIKDVNVILELGARDGLYTKSYLDFYDPDSLYSIDCNPDVSSTILENIKNLEKVKFYAIALSCKKGTVDFFINNDCHGSSSLYDHPICSTTKISVESKTLDDFCEEEGIEGIDLIIADVEGAEAQIFKDQKALKKVKYIIAEAKYDPAFKGKYFPHLSDLENSISPFGFKLVSMTYATPCRSFGDTLWIRQ